MREFVARSSYSHILRDQRKMEAKTIIYLFLAVPLTKNSKDKIKPVNAPDPHPPDVLATSDSELNESK